MYEYVYIYIYIYIHVTYPTKSIIDIYTTKTNQYLVVFWNT